MLNKSLFRRITALILFFSITSSQAAMISTETFIAQNKLQTPRERVLGLLEKEQVLMKLQELGVSPMEARDRLASLSDAEIEKLNAKMDALPAGADAGEAILGTALVVFIVLLFTDILCLTKVFRFTRCAN